MISALFSFDYSLTFTREVERIWKHGFSTPAVLFYLVRYPALMSVLFVILEETSWAGISDRVCSASSSSCKASRQLMSTVTSTMFSEVCLHPMTDPALDWRHRADLGGILFSCSILVRVEMTLNVVLLGAASGKDLLSRP